MHLLLMVRMASCPSSLLCFLTAALRCLSNYATAFCSVSQTSKGPFPSLEVCLGFRWRNCQQRYRSGRRLICATVCGRGSDGTLIKGFVSSGAGCTRNCRSCDLLARRKWCGGVEVIVVIVCYARQPYDGYKGRWSQRCWCC